MLKNKWKFILTVSFALLGLSSCDKESNKKVIPQSSDIENIEEPYVVIRNCDIGLGYIGSDKSKYFITEMVIPDTLFIKQSKETHYESLKCALEENIISDSEITPTYSDAKITLWMKGNCISEQDELFRKTMKEYGTLKDSVRIFGHEHSHQVLQESISGITIKALNDYNATHKAGSLLNDIALITYPSYYPLIMKMYQNIDIKGYVGDQHTPGPGAQLYRQVPLNAPLIMKLVKVLWYAERRMDFCIGDIEFTQPPVGENNKIQITLHFPSGKTLESLPFTFNTTEN